MCEMKNSMTNNNATLCKRYYLVLSYKNCRLPTPLHPFYYVIIQRYWHQQKNKFDKAVNSLLFSTKAAFTWKMKWTQATVGFQRRR